MPRIRTVKPELAKHEELYDIEKKTGLPIRFVWVMLFTVCDREGRFPWKPRALKTDVVPYDDVDFSRVLHALVTGGFIVKYARDGKEYGYIPTWRVHQVVNHKERASILPDPNDCKEIPTREPRVDQPCSTKGADARGEGNTEGKGKEQRVLNARGRSLAKAKSVPHKLEKIGLNGYIAVYVSAWKEKHGARPPMKGKEQGILKRIAKDYPLEQFSQLFQVYLQMDDRWFKTKSWDLGTFEQNLHKISIAMQKGVALDDPLAAFMSKHGGQKNDTAGVRDDQSHIDHQVGGEDIRSPEVGSDLFAGEGPNA